jgi:Uma2 family endonuclease
MVQALPDDGNRYETVHGELLVSPAPRLAHQVVLERLGFAVANYLNEAGLEGMFNVDADISWGPEILVQPDLFVADPIELRRAQSWSDVQTLHLVVEILSPSSMRADRVLKRRLYQQQRIPTYWVVDVDNTHVEIWTPDELFPRTERERLVWRHPAMSSECVVSLAELFRAW